MLDMTNHATLVRMVAVCGHLHHGKTSLVQMFVDQTHENLADIHHHQRFTDVRFDEEARGLSIKASPISFILPDGRDKSYLVHMLDTPGSRRSEWNGVVVSGLFFVLILSFLVFWSVVSFHFIFVLE
jgi:translation elongation factor EF-G